MDRYLRHASGEIYAISRALAQFVSINRLLFVFFVVIFLSIGIKTCAFNQLILSSFCRSILRTYAHEDVSTGSWFIGLDVKHVDEGKFCCSSWSSGFPLFLSLSLSDSNRSMKSTKKDQMTAVSLSQKVLSSV